VMVIEKISELLLPDLETGVLTVAIHVGLRKR
jgi:hypothetical protein